MHFLFRRSSWRALAEPALALLVASSSPSALADPVISELMAWNKTTLADDDGDYSDWVEIHNPDSTAVDLSGWSLTDTATSRTKWKFPGVSLPAQGYLVVFASNKNRVDPTHPLHTNFALDADGEYLGLIKPDGTTVASEVSPNFPAQAANVSYGSTQPAAAGETPQWGYFAKATPGRKNGDASALTLIHQVSFSVPAGPFTGAPSLVLSGAGTGEIIRYNLELASGYGAAVDDPTSGSTEYTGPLTLGQPVVIRAAVFTTDGQRHGAVTTSHYAPLETASALRLDNFSSQLPLLLLDDHGAGELFKDDIDHPAWFYAWERNADGVAALATNPGIAAPMVMSVRGNSSALAPKKSWKFELQDAQGKKASTSLFGLPASAEWNVVGNYYFDPSHIRSAIAYALSNSIGRWAAKTQSVEIFFNRNGGMFDAGDYAGVYTLTDKIEVAPDRIAITPLSAADVGADAITGGYLLRIDDADPEKFSWLTNRGYPGDMKVSLLVESPKLNKLAPAQTAYIKDYVQRFEDALYADRASDWTSRNYLLYIDRPSWVDHHLLNTFLKNTDAFWRSSYMSKDRNKKLVAGPIWDFDRSMGSNDGRDANPETWSLEPASPNGMGIDYWDFGWWGILAKDPEFVQAWIDRWQSLRLAQFSDESLSNLVDEKSGRIGAAAAARDAELWSANKSTHGDYAGEISHVKNWLLTRARWIDQQFLAAPVMVQTGDQVTVTPPAGTQLVYSLDGSDPRMPDGKPSSTATVSSQPVTLSAYAAVRARSYRAGTTAYPGSPWSGFAAISSNGVAAPGVPGRIVNLSSRARVSGGDEILIAGFVVADATSKTLLARAVGPSLADFGVTDALSDPVLHVFRADGSSVATNASWSAGPDAKQVAAIGAEAGAFPLVEGSHDAALVLNLPAGAYSMHVTSASNAPGTSLVELYEADETGSAINISSRAALRRDNPLIAGFVITGSTPRRLLIRGIGPGLTAAGVVNALADPAVTLYAGQNVIASNNDWGSAADSEDLARAGAATGAFPLADGSRDAVLLVTLNPGTYSAVVTSAGNASGIALVEVYELR